MNSSPSNSSFHTFKSCWAHAVNSQIKLVAALMDNHDRNITSLECDVIMSSTPNSKSNKNEPILAHPPHRESDLTLSFLLDSLIHNHNLPKHLKLDFKEIEAVRPSLELLRNHHIIHHDCDNDKKNNGEIYSIILNADILPGPGRRQKGDSVMMPADEFLSTCLSFVDDELQRDPHLKFAFSLGYKCDYTSGGYLESDATAMTEIVEKHRLASVFPQQLQITLALNARLLAKSLCVFDDFLSRYPTSTILAWTGTGEPPIPLKTVQDIHTYYIQRAMSNRIEFDCQIQGIDDE